MASFETAARADSAGILLPLMVVFGCGKKLQTQDRYLVTLGSCNDCHTPKIPGPYGMPVPDTKRLLSIPTGLAQVNMVFQRNEMCSLGEDK
jgi:hypothetical protein